MPYHPSRSARTRSLVTASELGRGRRSSEDEGDEGVGPDGLQAESQWCVQGCWGAAPDI